jgi:oligoribonuclease NrnB/cAMP/cGMP phosphodiesterase (DHH superfamily)
METPRTVILYHGNCPDGFGGAYAAWKKFGDAAEYYALSRTTPGPESFHGATLYFIDFCYTQEVMDTYVAEAGKLVMLDHHEGVEDVVRSMPEFVYDANRSGASIAWEYFHPGVPLPNLLRYVEDDDLFRFALPDTKAVLAYLAVQPHTFELWDAISVDLDNSEHSVKFMEKLHTYREYFDLLVEYTASRAKPVMFEGYEVYLVTVNPLKPFVSAVGASLRQKYPPFALMAHAFPGGMRISMRGDGTVDLTKIAQKYGGNGHPNSAAFSLDWGSPLPWVAVEEDEIASH